MGSVKFIANFAFGKMVIPYEIPMPESSLHQALQDSRFLKLATEGVMKRYLTDFPEDKVDILDIYPVASKEGKWVQGFYFAHEYDRDVDGRARRIKFADGKGLLIHQVIEVECLDKTLNVMDGYWDDEGSGRIGNGSGDYFYPEKEI